MEWGLEGCEVVTGTPNKHDIDGSFECHLDMPGFKRDPNNVRKFKRTGSVAGGFSMTMRGGNDTDTDDEIIRFDPEFTVNSDGGVILIGAPQYLTAYDDDILERPVTSRPIYLEFSKNKYIVAEDSGPAQPVINMYYFDDNGVKTTVKWCFLGRTCNQK